MKRTPLLTIIGALVVAIGIMIIVLLSSFRLTTTTPKNNSKNVAVTTTIVFTFSKTLTATLPEITSNPAIIGTISVKGKTVTLTPTEPLTNGVTYNLSIYHIKDTAGQVVASKALTFTTVSLSGLISALRSQLPYSTNQFSIDYTASDNTYSVNIGANPPDTVKSAALAWLAQYGVTPKNSTISFFLEPGVDGASPPPSG